MNARSLALVALLVAACDATPSGGDPKLGPPGDAAVTADGSDLLPAPDLAPTPDLGSSGDLTPAAADLAEAPDLAPSPPPSPFVAGASLAFSGRCSGVDRWMSICGSTYCTNSSPVSFTHATLTVAIDGNGAVQSTQCAMDGYGCNLSAQLDFGTSRFTNARYTFNNTGAIPGTLSSSIDGGGAVTMAFSGSGPISGSMGETLTLSCTWTR